MATQTYCVRGDIVSVIGEASLVTAIDDNANGQIDGNEKQFITDAINRAASEMNYALGKQYDPLSSLAGNEWCKWCNAYMAAFYLQSRRGNAPPASVVESYNQYREHLEAIKWGRESVPEATPTHDHSGTVSNFDIEMRNRDGSVIVDPNESMGATPAAGIKRNLSVSGDDNFF